MSRRRLDEYQAKRDFTRTAEPADDSPRADGATGASVADATFGRFVVQRHRARRLHYDLRLEMGGVLVSWAVPRGPTLDPAARHLAVHVEDHPLDYADFEGVIPSGEYGGGDVIVWDRGRWAPTRDEDPQQAVERGELHFDLFGEKLTGRFVLVRTDGKRRRRAGGRQDEWLLLHKRDDHAVEGWDPEAYPRSVKSGRTNEQVAAAPDALWRSDAPADEAEVAIGWPPVPEVVPASEDELAALDALPAHGEWILQGRKLRLTNLDKVLFPSPERGPGGRRPRMTKRDLIRYVVAAAPAILPYLVNRPVNLRRHPDGVGRKGFWQKAVPPHVPDWWRAWRNEAADPGETEWYSLVEEPAALAWLANYGAVELHPWTSTVADPNEPTWALFDLDPGERTSFDDLLVLARLHRSALEHLGVQGCPKVSGRRGIQILVPVARGYSFDDTRRWVEQVSRAVGGTVPELVSWAWHTEERQGLARLDYTQNAINRTLVAPFSPRAAAGAPVSVPIRWDELEDPALRPDGWSLEVALERLRGQGDPLRPLVVVRGGDGALRAFYNVCRHHAAAVMTEPSGRAASLRCPYHGWTYSLEGGLKGTPDFAGVCDFDRAANGLVQVSVAAWESWVFVRLADDGPALEKFLGDDLVAQVGPLGVGKLAFMERRHYAFECNWKVFVDNYLDGGYHVPHLHVGLNSVLDYGKYAIENGERHCLQHSPIVKEGAEPETGAVRGGDRALYYWIYPNFMINWYEGVMDTNLVLPLGVDRTEVIFDFYFPDVVSEPARARNRASIDVGQRIQDEDTAICKSVQRGLASRAYTAGRLSVRREAGEHLFHRLLHASLKEGLAG